MGEISSLDFPRAWEIFKDINNEKWTDEEKVNAINIVTHAESINSITKADMRAVLKYMVGLVAEK